MADEKEIAEIAPGYVACQGCGRVLLKRHAPLCSECKAADAEREKARRGKD